MITYNFIFKNKWKSGGKGWSGFNRWECNLANDIRITETEYALYLVVCDTFLYP